MNIQKKQKKIKHLNFQCSSLKKQKKENKKKEKNGKKIIFYN